MDAEKIVENMKKAGANKVFIQAPEGLKTRILGIASRIESLGIEVIVGCDPCYGACDLRDREAKILGCDLLLHIGHADFGVKAVLPVIYEPYPLEADPLPLLEENIGRVPFKKICLLTTVQFQEILEPAKNFLESRGKEILIGKQLRNGSKGILLGCDQSAALSLEPEVECFLFIGSGKFHPLGLARNVDKPVLGLDLESGELVDYSKESERIERVRAFHLEQAKEARNFGILVSTKAGQLFLKKAEHIKRLLAGVGKDAWILAMDEVTPEKIAGMKLDVLVNCACPRMDEDFSRFKKPVLSHGDVEKLAQGL